MLESVKTTGGLRIYSVPIEVILLKANKRFILSKIKEYDKDQRPQGSNVLTSFISLRESWFLH